MLINLIAVAVILPTPKFHLESASLFKNGFAVVTRSLPISHAGEILVDNMPGASFGTLWFGATSGVKLDEIETVNTRGSSTQMLSMDEILVANIGKSIKITRREGNTTATASVRLLSVVGDTVVIEAEGNTQVISKSSITSVGSVAGGKLTYQRQVTTFQRQLRIRTTGGSGTVTMVSLERGMTWSPAYAVELNNNNTLSLVAKATLVNDLEDLDSVEAKFVTGFPNVPFAGLLDPLTSGQSVDLLVGFLDSFGTGNFGFGKSMYLTQNSQGGGGGFGGGRAEAAPVAMGSGSSTSPLSGMQQEDLFFYRQPHVKVQRGERAYYVLVRATAPYEDLYTWDVDELSATNGEYRPLPDTPRDVWHTLKFKNTSGQPLTTAAASTFKDGELLGQDTLKYVPKDGEAELKITKAMNIHAEGTEEETARERVILTKYYNAPYDYVTVKGTLQVTNSADKSIKMRIRREFTGEVVSAEGDATKTKTIKGLASVNPSSRLVWVKDIAPGQTMKLTYTYKIYVRV